MKTLLFYINAINGGGAERVILQLARHFADAGYRSVLVTSIVDEEKEYDVPDNVIRLPIEKKAAKQSRTRRNVTRILALRRIVKKEQPVAVISFLMEPNLRALVATLGLKTKRIISVRNDPNSEYAGKIGRFIGKHILPYADGCVFQTEEAKAWFPQKLQDKSRVILNDVKEEFFEIKREKPHNVISLGRLYKQKNHALLIDAFAKIADEYPNEKLLIYGDGILRAELEQQITELGLKEKAILMGATNDVPSVLNNAKLFVLSSDYEGLPNCLMEALAAGVPCISTDCPCGGPKVLIRNGENGLLVPVGNVDALAKAIDRMLSDFEYAESIGENAKKYAKEFHPNIIFEQWKAYVESVIGE